MTTRAAKRASRPLIVREPGPMRGMPGSKWEGATNEEVMLAIGEVLGGPPERGKLYRVTFGQGVAGTPVNGIFEYAGVAREFYANGQAEHLLRLIMRNPVPPVGAKNCSAEDPLLLMPLDVHYIAPAEPGDLDVPMHFQTEGEPAARAVGRPPIQ